MKTESKLASAILATAALMEPEAFAAVTNPGVFRSEVAVGLRQCIAQAESEAEISALLKEGNDNYTMASEKTRRSWKRTAVRRQVQLRLRGQS